jgi:hypothetical protein
MGFFLLLIEIAAGVMIATLALVAAGALIWGVCWLLISPFLLMARMAGHLPNGPRQPLVLLSRRTWAWLWCPPGNGQVESAGGAESSRSYGGILRGYGCGRCCAAEAPTSEHRAVD